MKTLKFNTCKAEASDLINLGWEIEEKDKNKDVIIQINSNKETSYYFENSEGMSPHAMATGDDKQTIEDLKHLDRQSKLWEKEYNEQI